MARPQLDVTEGYRLGPYTLVAQIGRGGFAPVWVARELWGDVELRTVALKLFRIEPTASDEGHARIIDEARALCRVEHPNVVRFYAVATSRDETLLGIAMEYVRGESLDHRVAREGKLPVAEVLAIGSAVASALAAAHAVGLVHRDMKPANVIESQGLYKLIDFGIASSKAPGKQKLRERASNVRIVDDVPIEVAGTKVSQATQHFTAGVASSGMNTSGTMGYIDPAALDAPATSASDLYSLGATLFQCLTGQLPAAAAASLAGQGGLKGDVLDGRARSPSLATVMPGANKALVTLVDALLDPDPSSRPRSAESVSWELERIRREVAGRSRPLPPEDVGPFRGLSRFEADDRDVYFGRAAEVAASLEMMRSRGLVALVGASGSGKSSLARAGVLPAVVDGELGGWPSKWDSVVTTPGDDPWASLTSALGIVATDADALADALAARVQSTSRGVVLLVDQLEELVTLSTGKSRQSAVDFLARVGAQPTPGVRCLVAARRDLLDPLLALGALGRVLTRGTLLVSPMTEATWGEVIEQALSAYDYRIEDDALRVELLGQLRGTVDAMPLVQFALTELWKRRDTDRRVLSREAFRAIGGIAGALEMHVERVREALIAGDPELQSALYTVVMATTTAQSTRALIPIKRLRKVSVHAPKIIERLEEERIFVREGDAVTLTHEALLQQWSRLRRWLAEARADRLLAEEIERDAQAWTTDKSDNRVWRKQRLIAGEDLVKRTRVELSPDADAFLSAGRRLEKRGKVQLAVALGIALVAATAGAAVYVANNDAMLHSLEGERSKEQTAAEFATRAKRDADEARQRADDLLAELSQNADCKKKMTELQAQKLATKSTPSAVTQTQIVAPKKAQCVCVPGDLACTCDPNFVPAPVVTTSKPLPCGCPVDDLECNIKCSAAPFDNAKAQTSLAQIESSLRDLCLGGAWDAPSGTGRAKVTFATSGLASTVVVEAPYAGTEIGTCIENRFMMARVPSFAGDPVTVAKSFFVTNAP